MKRFLIRVAVFLLITAGALLLISRLYLFTQKTAYRMHTEDVYHYLDMPEAIDIAVFGNSHPTDAFRAGSPDERSLFRFSYVAQTLLLDEKLYLNYRDHLAKDAIVVFCVFEESFEADYKKTHEFVYLRHLIPILPFRSLPNDAKLVSLFRAVDFDTRDVIAFIGEAIDPAFCLETDGYGEDSVVLKPYEPSGEANPLPDFDHVEPEEITDVNQLRYDALDRMLSDAVSRGFRPVLLTTPFHRDYYAVLDAARCRKALNLINALAEKYGVPYFDHSRDPRFLDRADLFLNADHMSHEGSELFIPIAMNEIDAWYENKRD